MQVKLKPISHPELGDITINDPIFAIGRDEAPFAEMDLHLVSNLSRRHARVFQEAGKLYLADVGSRNGTRLNSKIVEQTPVRLLAGDEIAFAGKLRYQVEILEPEAAVAMPSTALNLILTPAKKTKNLEGLTINAFPFLVGKSSSVFNAALPQALENNSYLSRRHAHFFLKNDGVYLEDLGSTNGTFVNDSRLNDQAHHIQSGDEIVFGSKKISYSARLETRNAEQHAAAASNETPDHTIFVSSANSFLDIFCADDAPPDQIEHAEELPDAPSEQPQVGQRSIRKGRLKRFVIFIREISSAIREPAPEAKRGQTLARGLAVVAVLLVLAGIFFRESPEQTIEQLYEDQQYLQSLQAAAAFLNEHPGDETIEYWATKALIKHLSPLWTVATQAESYTQGRAKAQQLSPLLADNSEQLALLDVFDWISQLHQHINKRGGISVALQLFQDEQEIERLLSGWDQNKQRYKNAMALIQNNDPDFNELNRQTFSYLRHLRNEQALYLPAIKTLTEQLERHLNLNSVSNIRTLLIDFKTQYPRIAGQDKLSQDLEAFRLLLGRLESDTSVGQTTKETTPDWSALQEALSRSRYHTPPFQFRVAQLRLQYLPNQVSSQSLKNASQAWRNGDFTRAISILKQLNQRQGGVVVAAELKKKRTLLERYQTLRAARESDRYQSLLSEFHSSLDPEEDAFLLQAISPDLQILGEQTQQSVEQAWQQADSLWRAYLEDGGIRGTQRLEATISARFRDKAQLLTAAGEQLRRATMNEAYINTQVSPERQALAEKIVAETRLQKRSLEQLSMVLKADLLAAKLKLLAEPEAQ